MQKRKLHDKNSFLRNTAFSLVHSPSLRCFLFLILLISAFLQILLLRQWLNAPKSILSVTSHVAKIEKAPLLFLNSTNAAVLARRKDKFKRSTTPYVFDVLSIGSVNQIELIEAQFSTWASHPSRRLFFAATEIDDPDPNCHKELTLEGALEICNKCKDIAFYKGIDARNKLTDAFTNMFSNPKWLLARKNPSGWICAQRRLPFALAKVLRIYKEAQDLNGFRLPDYLILVDDDTIVNLSKIQDYLLLLDSSSVEQSISPLSTPVVFAGCRVRWPINMINFTFPFGGYGTFFSKGALQRMITPLYCNHTATGVEQEACERLVLSRKGGSNLGESALFKPGMSVGDLMGEFARSDRFCVHSDWAIGYFVNFYNISRHAVDDGVWFNQEHRMDDVKEARLHTIDRSEIYRPYQCHSDGAQCSSSSLICHRASPEIMRQLYGGRKV